MLECEKRDCKKNEVRERSQGKEIHTPTPSKGVRRPLRCQICRRHFRGCLFTEALRYSVHAAAHNAPSRQGSAARAHSSPSSRSRSSAASSRATPPRCSRPGVPPPGTGTGGSARLRGAKAAPASGPASGSSHRSAPSASRSTAASPAPTRTSAPSAGPHARGRSQARSAAATKRTRRTTTLDGCLRVLSTLCRSSRRKMTIRRRTRRARWAASGP